MGSAIAAGDSRAKNAIVDALDSPLLNDNKITGAKNVLLLIVSGTTEITIDEIGEINDHIQNEAGHNANIIMGVGEDESLGDGVAVTIIATGFNVEQQNEIVNTEPKKIVHALEDHQTMVRDLTQKTLSSFDFSAAIEPRKNDTPVVEEKIVYALEEEVEEKKPIAEAVDVPASESVNNLDVFFEIVNPVTERVAPAPQPVVTPQAPVAPAAPVFEVAPAVSQQVPVTHQPIAQQPAQPVYQAPVFKDVREIEVIDAEFVIVDKVPEDQYTFSFDLSINNAKSEEKLMFSLNDETRNIKVQEPVQVVPVTELNETGVIRYSLEEYLEKENELLGSKPVVKAEEPIARELQFTLKQTERAEVTPIEAASELSPMEMTIEETLRQRAEERRKKMKEFNYKFHNNTARIDEFEKEPAYKRMGIDLNDSRIDNSKSRLSLGTDSNDDLQLRSNNSFLHDNVD
jgi:cell division protein FtsZ